MNILPPSRSQRRDGRPSTARSRAVTCTSSGRPTPPARPALVAAPRARRRALRAGRPRPQPGFPGDGCCGLGGELGLGDVAGFGLLERAQPAQRLELIGGRAAIRAAARIRRRVVRRRAWTRRRGGPRGSAVRRPAGLAGGVGPCRVGRDPGQAAEELRHFPRRAASIQGDLPSAGALTARLHFRCRAKNWAAASPANCGTPVCPPMLACRVFSLEPKASNRSRAACRSFPPSSHCSRTCSGTVT